MSRSGYYDDCDDWLAHGRWRAQVMSAARGKRGQALLRDILAGLDALPEKRLIKGELIVEGLGEDMPIVGADQLVMEDGGVVRVGDVCALGAAGLHRKLAGLSDLDPEQPEYVADAFNVAEQLVREITYVNDEQNYRSETPEQRYVRVRAWVVSMIKEPLADDRRSA